MSIGELVHDLGESEPLIEVEYVRPGLWAGTVRSSWVDVARWLSGLAGGIWWPGSAGVTWVCGRRIERIQTREYIALVGECAEICVRLGAEAGDSVGACARGLLAWVGPGQYPEKGLFSALGGRFAGYHDCQPGQYPDVVQYDVSGCYYRLLCQLPTIRVSVAQHGLVWHAWGQGEADRWAAALVAVGPLKPLRNTLWGCMLGGVAGMRGFTRGREVAKRGKLGPFRPAAILIGRYAYELCARAAVEVESVLSHTDSVVALGGRYPSVWEAAGLTVREVAVGDAEVCSIASFRVGSRASEYYRRGSRFALAQGRDYDGQISVYDVVRRSLVRSAS